MALKPKKDARPEGGEVETDDQQGGGFPEPAFPNIGEPETDDTGGQQADPTIEELRQRLDAYDRDRETWAQREQRLQDTIDRLIQGQGAGQAGGGQQRPSGAEADPLASLPDPVEKPEEFRRALADYVRNATAQAVSVAGQQASTQNAEQDFWRQFNETYDDLAEHRPIVDHFAREEANRIRKSGGDPVRAIQVDPEGISERIARKARAYLDKFGSPAGDGEDGQEEHRPAPKRGGRTAGIPGGTTPAARPNGSSKPSSFVKELKDMQLKSGFF